MLQLLAELYATSPEEGDLDKPKFVMFIDEAHLIFNDASKALLDQIETVIKLIRSKGIGVYFVTQSPTDVPASVLAQLGLKIQHALRAFTATDRKAIKQTAENYPESDFYKTEDLITELGIGEALVTSLNEKGIPTPLVHTLMMPPKSRMDILTVAEVQAIVNSSKIQNKYNQVIDSESAYELLTAKLNESESRNQQEQEAKESNKSTKKEETWMDNPAVKQATRTAASILTRSLLGVLGLGGTTRRRKNSLF
jgi:DNA helicase HerA-like ATPase